MNKLVIILIMTLVSFEKMGAQILQTVFSDVRCGLNYTQASVLLGKRMEPYGYSFSGIDQPAPLVISGIPGSAKIEKAFIWWDIAGSDTAGSVILKNPDQETDTFTATRIGSNIQCWGIGTAFRADVTSIISGNGTYYLSGLPTDSTFDFYNKSDATGATLMVIYSDNANSYLGNLIIRDGYEKIYNDTVLETINFIPPSDTVSGKAFLLISDMQGEPGNAIKMNNGPYSVPSQEFWDFEQKNTMFVPSVNYSIYGVRVPNDCVHLLVSGIYFKTEIIPLNPVITRYENKLTSSEGMSYQWYFNNSPLANTDTLTITAAQSGMYYVEVTDSFGCNFFSDSLLVIVCDEKIKPNINFASPDSLWTDSVDYALQWFYNGGIIPTATQPYYIATKNGSYWVKAQDTIGCSVNSNIISVYGLGSADLWLNNEPEFYPNPNDGKFEVNFKSCTVCSIEDVEVYNAIGERVLHMINPSQIPFAIDLSRKPAGNYFLKIKAMNSSLPVVRSFQLVR